MDSLPPSSPDLIRRNSKVHDLIAGVYDIKHDEIYNDVEQARLEVVIDELLQAVDTPSPRVVELGSGTGNVTLKFLRRGCAVTATDVSPRSLEVLKQKAGDLPLLQTVVLRSDVLPFEDGTFDIAAAYSVLHHIPDYLLAVREMVRVLRPGGVLYIDHESCERAWTDQAPLREYRRLSRLSPSAHLRMLAATGELWTYDFWRGAFIKLFLNRRFIREGDLHVWPDDHIDWKAIFDIFRERQVRVLRNEDYLLYKPRAGREVYEAYRFKCADTKLVFARR